MIARVAAVGDLHVAASSAGYWRARLAPIAEHADLLLLAGDLTQNGLRLEAEQLARELAAVPVPIVAVLGNHDYDAGDPEGVAATLAAVGVRVLEGTAVMVPIRGVRVGVAGTKGFGGGFPGASGSEFGEPEMKAFMARSRLLAAGLDHALAGLDADVRLVLLHFSPVPDTLAGERPEIYPFLGSGLLADAIDRHGADLVLHGHAHAGSERGATPRGVPVRNVAHALIEEPYRVFEFTDPRTRTSESGARHG